MPGTVLGFSRKISSIFSTLLQSREDSPLSINGETEASNGKITCPSPCIWEWDQVCWLHVFGSSHYIIFPWRESDIFLWFTENKKEHKNKQIWSGEEGSVSATSSVSSLHRIKLLRHWEVRVKPSGGLEEGRDRGTPRRWGVVGSRRGRKNGPCLIVKASRGFLGMAGSIFRNANLHREAEIYLNMDSPPERF